MLLRVEVFPHNAAPLEEGTPLAPLETLHVSLATSRSDDGTVVSVGRKEGDVVLPRDKSVSRQHLRLVLVSKTKGHHEQLTNDDGEVIVAAAAAPATPEEIQACEDHGMCLSLKELHSKFGTFLAVERNDQRVDAKGQADEDDETGDETEDEADASSSGIPLSSTASKLVPDPHTLVFKRLKADSTVVLDALFTPNKSVLIQCGQNGSLIRLTRVPLNLIFSKVDASVKKMWTHRLYAIGASTVDSVDDMTHLVSTKQDPVAKQLAAWAMRKPVVTTDYLQQLWDRNANDKLPLGDEYKAARDDRSFWDTSPNPKLWSNCTLLCMAPSDISSICVAAGAKLVSLQGLTGKEFASKVDNATSLEIGCFFVDSSSRKITKQISELKKRGIPHVTQQIVARCISEQTPLTDHEKNVIGPVVVEELRDEKDASQPTPAEQTKQGAPKDDAVSKRTQIEQPSQTFPVIEDDVDRNTADLDHHSHEAQDSSPQLPAKSPKKRKEPSQTEAVSPHAQKEEKPPKRSRQSQTADAAAEPEDARKGLETTKRKRNEKNEDGDPSVRTKKKRSKEKDDTSPPMDADQGPRKKLAVSSDGWFVAAPSGNNRRSYRRPNDELLDSLDGKELVVAPTENRSGLVVKISASRDQSKSSSRTSRVDYKKFRKNSVPRSSSMSRIQLRSVLPKESEREQELELQQRQLDEEQRIADALFQDYGGGKKRSFFKPRGRKSREV